MLKLSIQPMFNVMLWLFELELVTVATTEAGSLWRMGKPLIPMTFS
jgi:hypothetical protein